MITTYDDAVFKYNLTDTDGFQFYTLIAYGEAREDDPNIEATKQNYKDEFERPPFIQKVTNHKFKRGNHIIRDGGNNIVYEKSLSTQYAANIEVLNGKFININSHPTDWSNIFSY